MATPTFDPKSGAVIIKRTPEEKLVVRLKAKVETLTNQVDTLESQVGTLTREIENLKRQNSRNSKSLWKKR